MKITFDTNTWQRVAVPHKFPNNPASAHAIHDALKDGLVEGFICETVVTLEAVPKGQRSPYLSARASDAINFDESVADDGKVQVRVTVGGTTQAHPGMHPILKDRLREAFNLGFKYIPVPRIGTARPPDFQVFESHRIPLTVNQQANIDPLLNRIGAVSRQIEDRGYGRTLLKEIATRIQTRHQMGQVPWFYGLDQPQDTTEDREIDRAFAEWADGDTVAVHIGYDLDAICTEDKAGGQSNSIFSTAGRRWLEADHSVEIINMDELADRLTG